ncbi:MAG: WecB/TagA/CpsF family glycosyltransferase [Clostridia bacterium]|nr:WecB/TagA/CpsF family glycosyltransferase [Clostridia bacterium]
MKPNSSVCLLGVPIAPLTRREAYARLARLAVYGHAARIVTPNPELLLAAKRDPEFHAILSSADLRLPDGVGVLLGARLLGARLPERVTGIDSSEWLLSFAAKQGLRVFLLGGRPTVAEAAADSLRAKLPDLILCGTHHGYFDKTQGSPENDALLSLLQTTKPDLLFVCFGSPAQERWISENANKIPSLRLCMGLGGVLDVWSGRLKRAPKLFQQIGLEWLWRTLREPKRLRRLPALPRFLLAVWKSERRI